MELIAASRIVKAQAAVNAAQPYSRQITRVISALASQSTIDHPLLQDKPDARRASPKRYDMKKSINLWAFPYPGRMTPSRLY